MLLSMGVIQVAIAYMIARVDDAYAPYALGMSLAIYTSAFLLIWAWQYTAALIGITWVALAARSSRRRSDPTTRRSPRSASTWARRRWSRS